MHDKFTTGCPDDNDWAVIMDEDKECDYHLEHEGNTQDDSYGHYSGDGSRPSLEDDLGEQSISNGYNPAMDVFQLQS